MSKATVSIKNILIIVFVLCTLMTIGTNGYIVFSNWMSSADKAAAKTAADLNHEIMNRIDAFFHVPKHINEVYRVLLENGIVDLENEKEREKFFVSVLKTHSNDIYGFSYGTETGAYYGARRNKNGDVEIIKDDLSTEGNLQYYSVGEDSTAKEMVLEVDQFDVRAREWYKAGKKAEGPVFSPVNRHVALDDLAFSAAYPVYNDQGEIQGVLGAHTALSNVDRYLIESIRIPNGLAIIAEKDTGFLIANSIGMENFVLKEDQTAKRNSVSDIDNRLIVQAYERFIHTAEPDFKIKNGSGGLYANVAEVKENGLEWVVITAIPDNMFVSDVTQSINLALLFVALMVFISLLLYYLIINRLIKPIESLTAATVEISKGNLSKRAPVIRMDEIGTIADAFNKMTDTIYMLVNNLETAVHERTAELEAANDALVESKDQLQLILDSTAEAIFGIDTGGNCIFCNKSCIKLLGYHSQDDIVGKNIHSLIHHSREDGTPLPISECRIYKTFLEGESSHVADEVFFRADGSSFDVEYYSYPQYKDDKIIGAVVTFLDVTERKKDDEQIKFLSCHDSLTGLLNRRCFEDSIKEMDTPENFPVSVIFADVNGLKMTNDIFGHAAGDALIRKSAEILKKACRSGDEMARMGGDEFIILLPRTSYEDAKKVMDRIREELSQTRIAAIKCSMSLGCDTKTGESQNIEQVVANAENAMYKEKTLNRKDINAGIISTIITALHDKSPKEKQHSFAVSALCKRIGQKLDLPETETKKLEKAGYLHDIGKIVLDEGILRKNNLTEEEIEAMRQHSVVGYRILNLFDNTLDLAEGVYGHHEKWNGTGYPKGATGKEIPVMARIIAVAEAYDALTSNYGKHPMSKEEALKELKNLSGTTLDPEITDVFIKMIRETEQN